MRERRRLKLMQRQAMMARAANRQAMVSLASTLDELAKSASLFDRSRSMAREYSERARSGDGSQLRELKALSGQLESMARDAERARSDADRQAEWQAGILAETKNRIKQIESRADDVLASIRRTELMRDDHGAGRSIKPLARKLQSSNDTLDPTSRTRP